MGKQDGPALYETGGEPDDGSIRFGPFELWPERRELRRDGMHVQLNGRALQLLTILVQRAGEVIGRRELTGQLWPDGGVDDSSLRAHIAALRRTLGQERYILNVLGRGYTFVGHCRRRAAAPPVPVRGPVSMGDTPPGAGPALGREEAIAVLCGQVLRQRLVSVVGAGGVGKSVVARAVAERLAADFADGVCLADFASVADGDEVARVLAGALGIAQGRGDSVRAICAAVDGARLLVVMDNCGHLADAVAVLAERLLAETHAPHFLVTSREALSLQEERVHRLAPLDTAHEEGRDSAAGLLFRARAGALGVRLDADDGARIELLCGQLDGNPLAIELAAAHAWERGLDGLESDFDWLFVPAERWNGGDERHRTLDAMLDWSVELLAPHERTVLRRLAVFRGDFTLDWAAEVCSCARIGPAQVVECTLGLSTKSLVNVHYDGAAPRYRLANTTRLYALRRLVRNQEAADMLRRHAASVMSLCLRADAEILRLSALEWRSRHAGVADELRAALDWCFSSLGDALLGIELAASACFVMCELGRCNEHRRQVLCALRVLERQPEPDTGLEQRLLTALTLLDALFLGDEEQDDAEWARVRLLELANRDSVGERPVVAYQAIAGWGLGQGCYPLVLEMAERIAACASRTSEPEAVVLATRLRAQGLHFLGRHEEAQAQAQAALDHAPRRRTVHYLSKVPVPVSMGVLLARTLWIRGRPDAALLAAEEALARAEGQHPHAVCMALGLAAIPVALWRGDGGRAQTWVGRFAALVEHAGITFWQPWRDCFRYLLEPAHAASGHAPLPSNSVLRDMLATFDSAQVDAGCLRRVREGLVGWNAPEVIRAAGVRRLLADNGELRQAEAAGLFLRARALAREQGAIAWELRAAVSLAELWPGGERGSEARQSLAQLLARFDEGETTADLVRARALLARAPQRRAAGALWCATLLDVD